MKELRVESGDEKRSGEGEQEIEFAVFTKTSPIVSSSGLTIPRVLPIFGRVKNG